jgi:SAM-dependent methyltransferase
VDAARYDRTRPPYPDVLIGRVLEACPGRDLLDVGCGTGIAARQLRAAGCSVLGVEPDERMAAFARAHAVEVEVATFEAWQPAGRTFDAVVAGTAWHWVDPDAGAVKAAQVLRPGGLLAPLHHTLALPPQLAEAITAACRKVAPELTFALAGSSSAAMELYQPLFDRMIAGIRASGRFTQPQQWAVEWVRHYTRDEWLDQLPSLGGLTRMAPAALAEVIDSAAAAIDAVGGSFAVRYTTVAITAARVTASTAPPEVH